MRTQNRASLRGAHFLDNCNSPSLQINRCQGSVRSAERRFKTSGQRRFIWVKKPDQPIQDHLSSRQIVIVSRSGDFNRILKKTLSRYRIRLHIFPNPTGKWIRDHYIIFLSGQISALAHHSLSNPSLNESALQKFIIMRRYIDEGGGNFKDYVFIHKRFVADCDGEGFTEDQHQLRFELLSRWHHDTRKLSSVIEGGNMVCTRSRDNQSIAIIGENSIFLAAAFLRNYTAEDTQRLHQQRIQLSKTTSLSSHTLPISDSRMRAATAALLKDLNTARENTVVLPQMLFHIDFELFQARVGTIHTVFLNTFDAVAQSIEAFIKRPYPPSSKQLLRDVLRESQRLDRLMQRCTQQQIDALQQKRITVVKTPGVFYHKGQLLATYMNALTGEDDRGRPFYIGLKYHKIFDELIRLFLKQQGFHSIHLIGKSVFNQHLLIESGGGLRCQTLIASQSLQIPERNLFDGID